MVNVQSEFIEFHDKIKLSYSDNAQLREKRDILLGKLRDNICAEAASYTHFNQGSYAMHTMMEITTLMLDFDLTFHARIILIR